MRITDVGSLLYITRSLTSSLLLTINSTVQLEVQTIFYTPIYSLSRYKCELYA